MNPIKKARINKEMSQQDLARKVGTYSRTDICRWETGKFAPSLKYILKLSEVLNIPAEEIIKFYVEEKKK